jgi:hypothetical protein
MARNWGAPGRASIQQLHRFTDAALHRQRKASIALMLTARREGHSVSTLDLGWLENASTGVNMQRIGITLEVKVAKEYCSYGATIRHTCDHITPVATLHL